MILSPIMAQASPAITPALRRLADQAADRALAALHAATHPAPGLLAAQTLAFSGHGAAYTASLEWHVR